jgi:hypothetical protein
VFAVKLKPIVDRYCPSQTFDVGIAQIAPSLTELVNGENLRHLLYFFSVADSPGGEAIVRSFLMCSASTRMSPHVVRSLGMGLSFRGLCVVTEARRGLRPLDDEFFPPHGATVAVLAPFRCELVV